MTEPELSIVLPAYEEAQSLSQVLPVLKDVAAELTPDSEIIVVDTMQPRDETPAVCEKLSVTYMPRRGGTFMEMRSGPVSLPRAGVS